MIMSGIGYYLDDKTLSMVVGSAAGEQPKFYKDGYWYKLDHGGKQGYSEYLASVVLSCSNIDNYVTYELCKINGKSGCRSKNFLEKDEVFYSLETLYMICTGQNLTNDTAMKPDVKDKMDFVIGWTKEQTRLDLTDYFSKMLSFDMLIVNTDRHFHNIGIIGNPEKGTYREAPIFDNGDAFLCTSERNWPTMEENIAHACSRTFAANFEYQAYVAGLGLKLDYDLLRKKLENEPPSYSLKVLKHQLESQRDLIPDEKIKAPQKRNIKGKSI